ncbi:hypothetical protein GPJ56_000378 [Histomonas meleagridis]|uniref:uncharacterized protein n=1 Tax=Histomonas meleagridis TaxID=135588 RepID=UPI00355A58C4|nr:hypothetical protein GPJ56_000378 [Histomonas meleagridis]KAH0796582.1 hypothetical protein GO595_010475 [Histomonas meleagridis]
MPQKTSHILRIKDGNIYLAQKNSKGKYEIYSPNGPENIKYNDTNDYVIHFNVTDIIDKYCYNEDNDNDEETEDITEDFEAFNQKLTFLTKLFNEFKDVETRTSLFARRKTDSFVSSSAYQEKRLRLKKYRTEKPQNCEMSTRCHSQVLFQININDSVKATQEKNKMYDFKIDENNNLKPTELKRRKPPIMGQRRRSTKGKHSEKIKANENVNESILNEKHSDDINGSILNEKQSDVLNKDNGDEDTKVNELEQKENIPNEKQSDGNEQENENIEEKHSGEENEKTQINELEQKENEILNEEHSDENEKEDNINTEENEKTEINEFEQNENEILNEEHSDGNEENVTNTENKEENDKIEINELEHNESDNQISDENDAKRSDNGTQESSTENKEENKSDNANEEDIDSDSSIVEVRLIEYSSGDESGSSSSSSSSDMEVEEEDEEF